MTRQLPQCAAVTTKCPTTLAAVTVAVIVIAGVLYLCFGAQWFVRGLWGSQMFGMVASIMMSVAAGIMALYIMPWREYAFDVDRRAVRVSLLWCQRVRWRSFEIPFMEIAQIESIGGEESGSVVMRLRKQYILQGQDGARSDSLAIDLDAMVAKFRSCT